MLLDLLFRAAIYLVVQGFRLAIALLFIYAISFVPIMRYEEGPMEPWLHTWNIKSGPETDISETLGYLFKVVYLNSKQGLSHFWLGISTGNDVNDVSSCSGAWVREQITSFRSGATVGTQTPQSIK